MNWRRNEGVTYQKKTNGTWVSQKVIAVDQETGRTVKVKGEGRNKAEAYENLAKTIVEQLLITH